MRLFNRLLAILLACLPVAAIARTEPADLAAWDKDRVAEHRLEWPFMRGGPELKPGESQQLALQLRIAADGRVLEASIRGPSSPYDAEAVRQALTWRYRPFLRDGRPAEVTVVELLQVLPPERRLATPVAFPETRGKPVSLWVDWGECIFGCAAYRVEIRDTGEVIYEGRDHVAIAGRHIARIDPAEAARLIAAFRNADFFSADDYFNTSITDQQTVELGIDIGGQRKVVREYAGLSVGMPTAVFRLERLLDETAGAARWAVGDDKTLDALRAEGFDPSSSAAGDLLVGAAGEAPESLVTAMIQAGAPVDRVVGGRTALEAATQRGSLSLLKVLEAAGAVQALSQEQRSRALLAAARTALPDIVAEAITWKGDPNARFEDGTTALCEILWSGSGASSQADTIAMVKLLLDAGADPNAPAERDDGNALFCAEEPDLIRLLLAHGARLEARDKYGKTPLIRTRSEDTALTLIDLGADVTAKDNRGDGLDATLAIFNWPRVRERLAAK